MEPSIGDDETLDTFYRGRIFIVQKKRGYRFSVDAPLLADFIRTEESENLLELGTGNAVISLLLSIKRFRSIIGLEIQGSLVRLARKNVSLNGQTKRIRIIQQDLKAYIPETKFDVIFSNPPYFKIKGGHLSSSLEKSIAKHELKCEIFDIMHKTSELLKPDGRAYFIFPVRRDDDFRQAVEENGMHFHLWRDVFPRENGSPNLFLTEIGFQSSREVRMPPLILFDREGNYTPEAQAIFTGRQNAATD